MSDDDITTALECIHGLAAMLQRSSVNSVELRLAEKRLLKLVIPIPFDALVAALRGRTDVELLMGLQVIARQLKCGKHAPFDLSKLVDILRVIVCDPSPQFRPSKRAGIACISMLILKYIQPNSIVEYLSSQFDKSFHEPILREIGSTGMDGAQMLALLTAWSYEIVPIACRMASIELLDAWSVYAPGDCMRKSGFPNSVGFEQSDAFEGTLVNCSHKPELTEDMSLYISGLLDSPDRHSHVLAVRLMGELTHAPDMNRINDMCSKILGVLKSGPMEERMQISEGFTGFFERNQVPIDGAVWDVLTVATEFPVNVDRVHTVSAARYGADQCENELLRDRFMQLRNDVRQIFRKAPSVSLERIDFGSTWQKSESILHALSALGKSHPQIGSELLPTILRSLPAEGLHRAFMNSLVICLTTHLKNIPDACVPLCVELALRCLSSVDTVDPTGWFPFRGKQDNSCVVFLQTLAESQREVDVTFLVGQLEAHSDGIKNILYIRDGFRQSRTLFVKSTVATLVKSNRLTVTDCRRVFELFCEDCSDMAVFLSACGCHFKQSLLSLVHRIIEPHLRTNSSGIESLVESVSDVLKIEDLIEAVRISANSPGFNHDAWSDVAPRLASIHGARFILIISEVVSAVALKRIPSTWFSIALPLVPVVDGSIIFHLHWMRRVLTDFASIPDHSTPSVLKYLESNMRYLGMISLHSPEDIATLLPEYLRVLVRLSSTTHCDVAVKAMCDVIVSADQANATSLIRSALSCSEKDAEILCDACRAGDYSKARRVMKKLAL